MEQHIAWEDLPAAVRTGVRAAVQDRGGPVTAARAVTTGQNSPLVAVIDAPRGRVFAKGMPSARYKVITQAREAATAPLVRHLSPSLLGHFDEAGWNVLGYQHAEGRHARYAPARPTWTAPASS